MLSDFSYIGYILVTSAKMAVAVTYIFELHFYYVQNKKNNMLCLIAKSNFSVFFSVGLYKYRMVLKLQGATILGIFYTSTGGHDWSFCMCIDGAQLSVW